MSRIGKKPIELPEKVSVKIAFFSTSVTLSVERRFAGADGDPSFAQSVTPPAWAGYLQAFA